MADCIVYLDMVSSDIRWKAERVSKTVIDLDDELLAEAAKELGTGTKKATVNAALRRVADQARRREALSALSHMDFSPLVEREGREVAWGTP
jgi:Arc/MetJ family transcription regulator